MTQKGRKRVPAELFITKWIPAERARKRSKTSLYSCDLVRMFVESIRQMC